MSVIAIIPAAGIGQRMGQHIPKQYLTFLGQTILEHSVDALFADPRVESVYIALQENDPYFARCTRLQENPRVIRVPGGATRAASVTNALSYAASKHHANTLVAVHDAARPGLSPRTLASVLNTAEQHPQRGALAAVPAWDTMKIKHDDEQQLSTLDRRLLWHAFTPQVFQLKPLLEALQAAHEGKASVTDEASAMERLGVFPVLVEAEQQLRKITCPEDLIMVEALMAAAINNQ